MRNKRAQGALEFLMTYGWAFLVILIMIGALAYFGVLNPTKFLPERCQFGSQMACSDFIVHAGGAVTLKLQNNVGNSIGIVDTAATVESEGEDFECTVSYTDTAGDPLLADPDPLDTGEVVGDGQAFLVELTSCNTNSYGSIGDKIKIQMEMPYYDLRSGSGFSHTLSGEVFATIET